MTGEYGSELLRYDRPAIADGEWWRLASGHFVHLGASHLALNMAGLCLVWLLVGNRVTVAGWLAALVIIIVGIDVGFWLLDPKLVWYVGFSGVLHGLLVAGAFAGIAGSLVESLVVLALVLAKLVYEQIAGPVPGTEAASGGPVVVNAHLYGAAAGIIVGIPLWRRAVQPQG